MPTADIQGPQVFGFERLDVYQRSVEFLALAWELCDALPRGQATLVDQLRRASLSIPLNIAEGTGRTSEADVGRLRGIARGSAMECAAILDALRVPESGTTSARCAGAVTAVANRQHAVAALSPTLTPTPTPTGRNGGSDLSGSSRARPDPLSSPS
jgi:four helix bundle protein